MSNLNPKSIIKTYGCINTNFKFSYEILNSKQYYEVKKNINCMNTVFNLAPKKHIGDKN